MRILIASSMFPPYCTGGVSSHVRDLAEFMGRMDQDVWVLSSRRGKAVDKAERESAPASTTVIWCRDFRRMFSGFRKLMASTQFDIIHFHSFNSLALAFLCAGDLGAKVFTIHSDTANYLASLHGWRQRSHPSYAFLRLYERLSLRLPDVTIAVSKRLQKYAQSMSVRRVMYIPNAVDCRYWTPPDDGVTSNGRTILVPRMLVPKNGVGFAVRAMKTIVDIIPDARMIVAGDGPLRHPLERAVSESRDGAIRILGDVPREEMKALYHSANVVLIPSITVSGVQEATSIAALEAMACGRPVVASRIGGLSEIIRNYQDGILVPEKSPDAIADAVNMLLTDGQLARRIGSEARRRAIRDFSTPTWAARVMDAYSYALDHGK